MAKELCGYMSLLQNEKKFCRSPQSRLSTSKLTFHVFKNIIKNIYA